MKERIFEHPLTEVQVEDGVGISEHNMQKTGLKTNKHTVYTVTREKNV